MNEQEILKLSEEIRLQRFRRKKSQEDCAIMLEISIPTYRELEYNPQKMNLEQAVKLSNFLGWNIFDFFFRYCIAKCNK